MKKRIIAASLIMALSMCLVACGDEIPDLTEEQTEKIADYSAALLLKYDTNSPSKLLTEGAGDFAVSVENTEYTGNTPDPSQTEAGQAAEAAAAAGDTPVMEEEQTETTVVDNTTDEVAEESNQDKYGWSLLPEGISINYAGAYELADTYPTEGDNSYFAVDATEGNKLLIIYFNVTNSSGSDMDLNMNNYSFRYRVSVNGGVNHYILSTMLSNDILSYSGTVAAGAGTSLVAVAEIPIDEAADIQTLDFVIKSDLGSYVMTLQ